MKFNIFFYILSLIILTIVLQSCEKSPVIKEKEFIKIYAEMIFMQDTTSLTPIIIKENVLKRFNVTDDEYIATVNFYNENPERWPKFFDEVIVYIQSLKPKPKTTNEKSSPKQSVSVDKKNL